MTENKRFRLHPESNQWIWDTEAKTRKHKVYSSIDAKELIDVLNELDSENKELKEELDYYKNQCIDENVKWLRENTVWEQMPSKIRTHTKISIRDDLND